ncbi:hypothetical protein PHLCEN_2v5780 [Hermanssonia centrifuga]|uniref:Uncharacterized protein n=1 Tax=Hermanssonia centrifuga TaxID=98765 RepID=A0A2R6P1D0_9APHY|nr:hypothetical protein PHLCEN_2v5780 [Hermanssonia centrifuga]
MTVAASPLQVVLPESGQNRVRCSTFTGTASRSTPHLEDAVQLRVILRALERSSTGGVTGYDLVQYPAVSTSTHLTMCNKTLRD